MLYGLMCWLEQRTVSSWPGCPELSHLLLPHCHRFCLAMRDLLVVCVLTQ
jgi:hypothetical protein